MKMNFSSGIVVVVFCSCCLMTPLILASERLTLSINNQSGDPVEYAVISAHQQNPDHPPAIRPPKVSVIDQIDKEFFAYVTPIKIGTAIAFPNHDQIRHHVYSFSPAKNFEIPLYKGVPETPILFDKIGVVSLGCNIHDWMSAYIYVIDTPYFTMTDKNGHAVLELPPGEYEIQFWHPNIDKKNVTLAKNIKLDSGTSQSISMQLDLKQTWSFRRGPLSRHNRGRYR